MAPRAVAPRGPAPPIASPAVVDLRDSHVSRAGACATDGAVPICFEVRVETNWGDTVVIVGATEQFGAWRPEGGLRLSTDEHTYPVWRAHVAVDARSALSGTIEYKAAILRATDALVEGGARVEWEPLALNRKLATSHAAGVGGYVRMNWGEPSDAPPQPFVDPSPHAPCGAPRPQRAPEAIKAQASAPPMAAHLSSAARTGAPPHVRPGRPMELPAPPPPIPLPASILPVGPPLLASSDSFSSCGGGSYTSLPTASCPASAADLSALSAAAAAAASVAAPAACQATAAAAAAFAAATFAAAPPGVSPADWPLHPLPFASWTGPPPALPIAALPPNLSFSLPANLAQHPVMAPPPSPAVKATHPVACLPPAAINSGHTHLAAAAAAPAAPAATSPGGGGGGGALPPTHRAPILPMRSRPIPGGHRYQFTQPLETIGSMDLSWPPSPCSSVASSGRCSTLDLAAVASAHSSDAGEGDSGMRASS